MASVQPWYQYPYGLTFGQGDPGIGGEHGADFDTPLFAPITALLGGTVTAIHSPENGNAVDYGNTLTFKLDVPWNGVPYMYHIHMAAINPNLRVGSHVNPGDLIGYSGGATPSSVSSDMASTPYHLPSGLTNYLDSSVMSGGAHSEVGFTYNSDYGSGGGFNAAYLAAHPELNPKSFLDQVRAGQIPVPGFNPNNVGSNVSTGNPFTDAMYQALRPSLISWGEHIAVFLLALLLVIIGIYLLGGDPGKTIGEPIAAPINYVKARRQELKGKS